jgi:hypothetical protein
MDNQINIGVQQAIESGKKVKITIQNIVPLRGGRVKVKIAENDVNLIDMTDGERNFVTIKNYGRGRYLMREVIKNKADVDKEWEDLDSEKL